MRCGGEKAIGWSGGDYCKFVEYCEGVLFFEETLVYGGAIYEAMRGTEGLI